MHCMAPQDGQDIMKSADRTWYTGEENCNPLQYSCLENPRDSNKKAKRYDTEDEPPKLEGVQYTTAEEWRAITDSCSKNEVAG